MKLENLSRMKSLPYINFAHLCDMAFLSQDKKMNIIGIFKVIPVQKVPYVHSVLTAVVNAIINQDTKIKLQILKRETGEIISQISGNLQINNNDSNSNNDIDMNMREVKFITEMKNITFQEFGEYYLEVWLNNKLYTRIPFLIIFK